MTVTWAWDLEAYISGAWVSIASDVMNRAGGNPVTAERGIEGSDITNRVASPGSLTCALDNGESNSAGKLGYYSPEHADFRANFGRYTKVRLKITYGGNSYYKWYGYIDDLDPTPGRFKERKSYLTATDYMQLLSEQKIDLLAVQEDKRSDQIVETVLTAMTTAPVNESLETDKFSLPFALSAEQDERTSGMSVLQKVCQTVLGYAFVKGDTTDGETFVFEREETRALRASSFTLDETMSEIKVTRPTDKVKNRLVGKIHPVRVDDEAVLLYELENDISVDGGDTQTFTFRFRDPANLATRISALDIEALEANVHYRASQWEGTSGNDATSLLTITPANGGNSAEWEVENTGGFRVHINLAEIFGRGIYYFNPIEIVSETGAADKQATYDFFYLSSPHRARAFLSRLLERTSTQSADIESVVFYADANSTLMGYAMTNDIGSRGAVTEGVTGVSGEYVINKVKYTIETSGKLRVEWRLEPADTNDYFILDSSLLDGTDVLSPY